MLLENTTLVCLSLSANELSDKAASHLSLAITSNQRLERLDLSHNKLGDAAGRTTATKIETIFNITLNWSLLYIMLTPA